MNSTWTRALLLAACASSWAPLAAQQAGGRRLQPNILLIVLDDLGTDKLRLYHESDSSTWAARPYCGSLVDPLAYPLTPNLDQLANGRFPGLPGGAVRFDRAYAAPLCTMARACIQTGRYGFRNGLGVVEDGGGLRKRMDNGEVLLSEILKGGFPAPTSSSSLKPYATGAFGKWHLTALPVCDAVMASDFTHAVDNGFDIFQGTMANVGTVGSNPGDHYNWTKVSSTPGGTELIRYQVGATAMVGPFQFSPGCTTPGTLLQTTTYSPESWSASVTRADAVTWINETDGPFFAYVAFNAPHFPYQVPPLELLSPETQEVLMDPANCGGPFCAGQVSGTASPCGTSTCGDFSGCQSMQQRVFFNAMAEAVDTEIGNLLLQMDPAKLANTIVLVLGDNGTPGAVVEPLLHDPEHGKGELYELSVRVPLIAAGHPIPGGAYTSQALVHAVDLWRTVAQLAGAKESLVTTLGPLDSISFRKVLLHPGMLSPRDEIFCQGFVRPGAYVPTEAGPYELGTPDPTIPGVYFSEPRSVGLHGRSLCDGQYKLHVVKLTDGVEVVPPGMPDVLPTYEEQLYDLLADPDETTDLIPLLPGNPTLQAIRDQLRARLTQLSGY